MLARWGSTHWRARLMSPHAPNCKHWSMTRQQNFGTIEVLVNNAGIFFNASFDAMTDDEWDRMMDVNLKSVFVLSQIVIRHWLEQDIKGAIVNLASISAAIAFTNSAAYCTAKAGVASMTRCIALEYGPRGIRANSMAPGVIDTGMPNAGPGGGMGEHPHPGS